MGRYDSRLKKLEVKHTPRELFDFEIRLVGENENELYETREGELLNSKDYAAYCKRIGDIFITIGGDNED